jgi:Flp pilus assembly protein TadD/SAM-dependent methyltransferase
MATVAEALTLAFEHHQAGRLGDAEAVCAKIRALHPHHPDALHLLGLISLSKGRHDDAIRHLDEALKLNPRSGQIHNSLGEVYRKQGQFAYAGDHYRKALALDPSLAEAHCNLGISLRASGEVDLAISHCKEALRLKPSLSQAHNNLGGIYFDQRRRQDAINCFESALRYAPESSEARANLALALRSVGRLTDALRLLFDGLSVRSRDPWLRRALAEALQGVSLDKAGKRERQILQELCSDDNVASLYLAPAIIGLVKASAAFHVLLRAVQAGLDPIAAAPAESAAFFDDALFRAALPRIPAHDTDVELLLTSVRRSALRNVHASERKLAERQARIPYEFQCALARHCFLTDYAFLVTPDERKEVSELRALLKIDLAKPKLDTRRLESYLVAFALYEPLDKLVRWERLLEIPAARWTSFFGLVLQQQLKNRQRETELAAHIPTLTPTKPGVSHAVRAQYEDHPYPVWVSIQRPEARSLDEFARKLRRRSPAVRFSRPIPILVAGCGTGQHPIRVAITYGDSHVLALDLSRMSLAYAARMAEYFGVRNLTFAQADILRLERYDDRFALIECSGVLHHMRDPLEGWRILARLLAPGGIMKIALYSERARRNVAATRAFVRERGFRPTQNSMRHCRRAIMELPAEDPIRSITAFGDFYSLNGFRDLAMHVQEHLFTPLRIAKSLDSLGLQFLAMDCAPTVLAQFDTLFPAANARTDLARWDEFERTYPHSFSNMYQFWCCAA